MKHQIRHSPARAVLSEFLPYELSSTFSNQGLYAFLLKHGARFQDGDLMVRGDSEALKAVLKLLVGPQTAVEPKTLSGEKYLKIAKKELLKESVPYRYRIRHGEIGFRELSIPHPRAQLAFVDFYDEFSSLITYFASRGNFSIRRPVREARFSYVRDNLFKRKEGKLSDDVEVDGFEYSRLRSFFKYESFSNIHGFYESDEYRSAEKSFGRILKLDITKCFDSIYTHAATWAVYGRENVKSTKSSFNGTFPDQFDVLIRSMNENETNGILIGPEVSRIFAEIVLQRVDREVEEQLRARELIRGVDYQAFRYIDDFFIFYNAPEHREVLQRVVVSTLQPLKMHLNDSKTDDSATPMMTKLTMAKDDARTLIELELFARATAFSPPRVEALPGGETMALLEMRSTRSARNLISGYKAILAKLQLKPVDIANYVLVQIEEKLEVALAAFLYPSPAVFTEVDQKLKKEGLLTGLIAAAIEFSFFVYSGSAQVSAAIKLARICALALKSTDVTRTTVDRAHFVKQLIYSEVCTQLARHPMGEDATVESLYLLDVLSALGDDYNLPVPELLGYLGLTRAKDGQLEFPTWTHSLVVLTLLRYVRNQSVFEAVRDTCERWIERRLEELVQNHHDDAERSVLSLDSLTCPYINVDSKRRILRAHKLAGSVNQVTIINGLSSQWFTRWPEGDLHDDLLAKRSQHVY